MAGNIARRCAVNLVDGLRDGPALAPRCGSRGGPKGPVLRRGAGPFACLHDSSIRSQPAVWLWSEATLSGTVGRSPPFPRMDLGRTGCVLRCLIATAGVFAVLGSACAQGLPKRLWIDPPAEAVQAAPASGEAKPWPAPPAAPWPDEASRRSAPRSNPAAAPQETVAALEDPDPSPDLDADVSSLEPLPPPASSRARRRLGPLAGFSATPQTDTPDAREPTVQTGREQTMTVSRSRQRQVRRYLGQVRTVKFRKRRIILMFTRF